MDSKTIQTIARQVYRKFPELSGVEPTVRLRKSIETQAGLEGAPTYLLTFQSKGRVTAEKSISRLVRVVSDAKGRILKISTSR